MGFFSSKKNLCPLCGGPTPKIFPAKIEGKPICKECDGKIDLPNGAGDMSFREVERYIACYDANQLNRERFHATYTYGGEGFFGSGLAIDETHGLFKVKKGKGTFAFDAEDLVSFRITEDNRPIFEGDENGLLITESDIEKRLENMEPEIRAHNESYLRWERWENIRRLRDRLDDNPNNDQDYLKDRNYRPSFYGNKPIDKYHVYLTLNHPYWNNYEEDFATPGFDTDRPSTFDYRSQYTKDYEEFREFAEKLMALINPAAPIFHVSGSSVSEEIGGFQTAKENS